MAERAARTEAVWRIADEVDDVAPAALEAALRLIERAAREAEEVEVTSALDLSRVAASAEILHRISRLASGQSTANVAHAGPMSAEERAEAEAYLRSRLTTPPPTDT